MRPEGSRKEEPINGKRHEKRKVREEKPSAILRIIENMNGSYFKLSHLQLIKMCNSILRETKITEILHIILHRQLRHPLSSAYCPER